MIDQLQADRLNRLKGNWFVWPPQFEQYKSEEADYLVEWTDYELSRRISLITKNSPPEGYDIKYSELTDFLKSAISSIIIQQPEQQNETIPESTDSTNTIQSPEPPQENNSENEAEATDVELDQIKKESKDAAAMLLEMMKLTKVNPNKSLQLKTIAQAVNSLQKMHLTQIQIKKNKKPDNK